MLTNSEQPTQLKGSKAEFSVLPIYEEYPYRIDGITERSYITAEQETLVRDDKYPDKLFSLKEIPKGKRVLHDSRVYTKVFTDIQIKNLSVPASNLLYMIIARLSINSCSICIDEEDFTNHCGYKKNSRRLYYQAVAELVKLEIIAKRAGMRRCYWVNANVIFNGDRTKIKNQR